MVGTEAAAILVAEIQLEDIREGTEQIIALCKAVFAVEILHSAQIHVQKRRRFAAFAERPAPLTRKLKEIRHIRQSGEVVAITRLYHILLAHDILHRVVQSLVFSVAV